jgi:SPP1 family predicted phage head-tail adaptor
MTMPEIKTGERDRLVTVQSFTTARDAMNEPIKTWSDLTQVWAKYTEVSDRERLTSREVGSELQARFWFPYCSELADLDTTHRLVMDSKVFEIIGVKEIGRRYMFEVTCGIRSES